MMVLENAASVLSAGGGRFFCNDLLQRWQERPFACILLSRGATLTTLLITTVFKPQTKTDIIKRFIFDAGSSIISVEFIKADGTVRKLQFNPLDSQEVKGTGHALKKPNIVRCRDFAIARKEGEGAWRSFDCERVVKIQAHGTVISF
jgi:hypothetical protein